MQYKNEFDRETLIKIGKGALIAMTAGASLSLLNFLGTIEIDNPVIANITVILIPVIVNAIKEWSTGQ